MAGLTRHGRCSIGWSRFSEGLGQAVVEYDVYCCRQIHASIGWNVNNVFAPRRHVFSKAAVFRAKDIERSFGVSVLSEWLGIWVYFDCYWNAAKRNYLLQIVHADEWDLQMNLFCIRTKLFGALVAFASVKDGVDTITSSGAHDRTNVIWTLRIVKSDAGISSVCPHRLIPCDSVHIDFFEVFSLPISPERAPSLVEIASSLGQSEPVPMTVIDFACAKASQFRWLCIYRL